MSSPTEENYLKSLFLLGNDQGEINLSDLSKSLQVSTPTANSMVKKLHDKGLLLYEKYKPLQLTSKGKKEAALIIRKHRLTEMFLVEIMNFGWEEVHDIAEQIEHINSPAFFERMDEFLNNPTIDPHGSPIPDKNGKMIWKSYVKLSECQVGNKLKLVALTHSSNDFLKFLNSKELSLGTTLKLHSIEPFDQSITVSYKNHPTEIFSSMVSERLLVEMIK